MNTQEHETAGNLPRSQPIARGKCTCPSTFFRVGSSPPMATEYPPLSKIHVVGYSANDKDYPILNQLLDPRVAGYKVPEDFSACPDKRYPNHIFTGAQPISGDQRVRHAWEILPSPWVPFTRYDDDLGPVQGRRRSVKNEGQQASLTSSTKISYEGRDGSSLVLIESEETWSIKTDDDGNSLFPIKVRDLYDEARGPVQETRQLFVPDGTEEGSLVNQNGVITKTSYEVYNEYLSFKIVETWNEDGEDLNGSQTGQWGVESTERTLVPSETQLEYGFGIKSSGLIPASKEQSEKRKENYPEDSDNDGVIYTLRGQEQDEVTKAVIAVEKSLVEAETVFSGRVENYISGLRSDNYLVEVQPVDKWHSITIASKIIGAPNSESWTETGNINLPNELLEVGIIWDSDFDQDAGTAGVNSITDIIVEKIAWATKADCSITGRVVGASYVKVRNGYNGPAKMYVVRTFHQSAPTDAISVHKFEPVYGTITIKSQSSTYSSTAVSSGVGDINTNSGSSIKFNNDYGMAISQIGPIEHNGITSLVEKGDPSSIVETVAASAGSTPYGPYPVASATLDIKGVANLELPTSSIPLYSGDQYILNVNVKPWRLGWWVKEVYTAEVP